MTQQHTQFDAKRASLEGKPSFLPLVVKGNGPLLCDINLPPDEEIIVAERNGKHVAFQVRQMSYHHLAQGELAGEPYLVSF